MTRARQWLKDHPNVIGFLLMGVLFTVILATNRAQDSRERHEDAIEVVRLAEHDARTTCLAANESRRLIREIGVQLALANAEALIAVVEDADPADVEAFRQATIANAEQTVSALADRNCPEEVQEAVNKAAEIQGVEAPTCRQNECS